MKTRNFILATIVMVAFFACQKDDTTNNEVVMKSGEIVAGDINIESALDEANYEAELFSQSGKWLRELSKFHHGKKNLLEGKHCDRYANGAFPAISIDTAEAGYPITILIDYGDGIEMHHGKIISGTVSIEITAEKNTEGAQRIIKYNNCKIDSVTVTGTEVEIFNGDNATTRKTILTSNVNFKLDNGTEFARTGTTTHEWLEGISTQQNHSDDKIQKTGETSIISSTGNKWTKKIVSPLIRLGDCHHYVQGTVDFILNGDTAATLDYGSGDCDNTALLTIGYEQVEITLQNIHSYNTPRNLDNKLNDNF